MTGCSTHSNQQTMGSDQEAEQNKRTVKGHLKSNLNKTLTAKQHLEITVLSHNKKPLNLEGRGLMVDKPRPQPNNNAQAFENAKQLDEI